MSTLLRSSYNNIHHSPLLHTLIHSLPPLLIYLYSPSHTLISPTAYTTPVYLQQILAPHVRNAIQATTPRLATIYLFLSISLFLSLLPSHPSPSHSGTVQHYTTPVYLQQLLAPHVRSVIQATTLRRPCLSSPCHDLPILFLSPFLSFPLFLPLPRTAVPSNCLRYTGVRTTTSSATCTECNPGYYPTASGSCQICTANCQLCAGSNACAECTSGHRLVSATGQCVG